LLFNIFRGQLRGGPILSVVMEVEGVEIQYFWIENRAVTPRKGVDLERAMIFNIILNML
jgi:hypothetical protein